MRSYSELQQDQLDCIDFIRQGEDALIAADVGTGKTVISLTATKDILETRWLVLAPLLVATDTWPKEIEEWEHLKDIDLRVACGTEEQRIAAIESDAQYVTMNYENLPWLLEHYPKIKKGKFDTLPFNGIIFDELDKLKSVSSNRFKDFRNRINHFDYRIGMTGTLIPNKLTELWGQVYMVDGGQTFGRSFYEWRKQYFYPTDFKQYKWAPFEKTPELLINELVGLVYRLPAKGLPQVTICEPDLLTMPAKIMNEYKELEKEFFLMVERDDKTHEIEAASAGVLTGKLQQICAGFSYVGDKKNRDAVWHSKAKFDWLDQKLMSLGDEQVLIFYHFNEELEELKERVPDLCHIGKGTSNKKALEYIDLWNKDVISELALHPASAGHGLNLQKSGAHHAIFLTMPWSGGLFHQSVGRLARRGNPASEIFVHSALFDDTVDLDVFGGVTGKLADMEHFLDDLEAATA